VLQNQHYRSVDRAEKTMKIDGVIKIISCVSYSITNADPIVYRVVWYVTM
jgi:hypothetical protein